ncbi:OmpA family protein [Shinella sp. AETb1-6]|uniref:OmpA family protein n=1 Tax=Shinella sp. AETb1-6 TaxID=2692210 RepID=UPI001369D601|nr:OmpA family protein [Shinella sp. AETb1-6]MXN49549.1 OmpA family protein [Shinella sp. AETb1-6]
MTFRSKLFATVAFPVLSASLIATPALADALMKPFEVAQDSGEQAQPSEEELLQQRQAEEQRAAEEEAQRQAEEQQRAAEEEAQRAAEEQQKAAEQEAQRQAEEQQKAAEEEAQRQAEEQQRAAEEEAQRAAEEQQKAADEEAQRAAAEQQKAADEEAQRQAEEQQKAADEEAQRAAAEQQKAADEEAQRQAEEQQKAADEEAQRAAAEQQKAADEEAQRQAEEQRKAAEEQQQQTEQQQPAEEQPVEQQPAIVTDEQQQQPADGSTAEQPAEGGTEQPATAETGETPAGEPVPEVVDTLSPEEKQAIAEDPGKTDETVVLPVENGAAVLDSDKDADNTGGRMSREERRKQREELRAQEEVPLPVSDDSAQAEIPQEVREAVPQKIEAAIKEEGQRVDAAPVFAVPETTNIVNNTVINNTVINNNTVNNNTVNNNVTQVNVVETIDNRTVLSVGNQLIVRGDDRPRLRRDSEEVYYDELARGRTRETIVRPGGVQIITIYNRYGDVIQRSRIGRDGREYILVYAPELEDDAPRPDLVDVGYELPPMRLRIPLRDYIVDTSSDPDRDYYEFLSEPPVERVERVYTINEVKQSARLRDKVRRIDLDTVTFATGSAEVPMSQARTLRKVAEAMSKILDKDPGETFLIEGHTDAVGSDKSNLVLSDRRADSVASLLTEVYGIPPENLQTQGYGERFLKVRTQSAEQQNRRVTIRRVTTLVRPVASAN